MGKTVLQKMYRVGDIRKDVKKLQNFILIWIIKPIYPCEVLCSPLIVGNECIGVIHYLNKEITSKLFEEGDRKLLEF